MAVAGMIMVMVMVMPIVPVVAGRQAACLAFLVPVDRHGGVLDLEMALQLAFDGAHDDVGLRIVRGPDVHRCHRATRRDRPHMDMTDRRHARHMLQKMTLDLFGRRAVRRAFEQDVKRLGRQLPRATQDQQGDEERQDRVDRRPARQVDHDCRAHSPDRAEQVAHDVQRSALDVDMLAVAARQNPEYEDIDQQPRDRDAEHRAGQDRLRLLKAFPGFIDDPAYDREQRHGVDEAGDHLEAQIAEGALGIGRTLAKAEGRIGERQRRRVGHHMPGVRQQGERAGDQAAHDLDDHEGEDQAERQQHLALIVAGDGRRMRMIVIVAVTMIDVGMGHYRAFIWIE